LQQTVQPATQFPFHIASKSPAEKLEFRALCQGTALDVPQAIAFCFVIPTEPAAAGEWSGPLRPRNFCRRLKPAHNHSG